ncbi:Crp/Fnr family transcriptional regulator [Candidatus Aalborgicola defluviihabitans]|uniref:Crp/Fnr family transcriptional regulator n=1 Tax=Candidatus Aalborgicola defluviihabitans TaxID=3386187 RepID=UPI001DAA57E0|nr:Crp/Fnr family transcriptional regulator [Burkholderiales bacterium]MBK6569258.1 Crp/Fnr family transcriptional regulator [Burkholderiales bacterium]MBK7280684.1 Crp/Fnr family transcriptional regulator [Burkholderiales bacterium]MBL0244041.1 Crp/Fnr family transcriptional regulator [Rhodoferax sp.]
MSMLSNLDLIRRVSLFAMLTPAQAESLAAAVTKKRFKRGETLVEQGKLTHSLYIILSGRTRVLMTDNKAREVILATLKSGDYVGEMSLIDSEPHSATVIADQQVDVLVLGRDAFLRCLGENTGMSFAVMHGLVQRLRSANQKISSLALMGVYGRVALVLLDSAVVDEEDALLIREKVSRQDIAKMVGASREMVGRVMKDFEEQGFIKMLEGGMVRVFERRVLPR